jgi:hypothetical protein
MHRYTSLIKYNFKGYVDSKKNDFDINEANKMLVNLFEEICHEKADIFLFVLNINHIESHFDNNFASLLEIMHILFGDELFNHSAVCFTFCENNDDKINETKKTFNKLLQKRISISKDLPLFFLSNKKNSGFKEIEELAKKMGKIKSKIVDDYQELEKNKKSKEELDNFIIESVKKNILDACNIL